MLFLFGVEAVGEVIVTAAVFLFAHGDRMAVLHIVLRNLAFVDLGFLLKEVHRNPRSLMVAASIFNGSGEHLIYHCLFECQSMHGKAHPCHKFRIFWQIPFPAFCRRFVDKVGS